MPAGLINRSARRSHELKSAKVHTRVAAKKVRKTGISHSCDGWLPPSNNCAVPKISDEIITRFRNRVPEGLWGGDPQNGRRAVGFATARRAVPHAPNEVATAIDRRPTIMGGVWPR